MADYWQLETVRLLTLGAECIQTESLIKPHD